MEVDISKVCRLCLKGNEVLAPIFAGQQNGVGTSLPHRIMACAQVKVAEGDGLPPNVCTSCLSQVDRSYQFKLLCERSDSALRGNFKNENPSDDECSDNGEGWDMTKFTPEVIIKEDTDENSLSMNGGGEDGHGYYGHGPLHMPSNAMHTSHIPNSHLPSPLSGSEPDHHVALRMAQHTAVDLRTTGDGLMLNGLVFPLPTSLAHLPPPGPSNNSRSRRCRGGDKLFKCRQCNKSYSFSSALSRHKAVHNTALRPHVCQICKKGFTDMDKLMRHEKTHTMDILMTCDLCHRPFRTFTAFQRHRATGICTDVAEDDNEDPPTSQSPRSHTPPETTIQAVPLIQPPSQEPSQQPTPPPAPPPPTPPPPPPPRRESGKGKPEFKCQVCLKNFATRGSLDVHSTIHTGVRPFVCSVCHKSFRHKVNLMEHFQRKHSQVRPYICDVCAARFVTKQELVRHYRKHIGD